MTRAYPYLGEDAKHPAYRVEAPRASDAISLVLRNAFEDRGGLPEDMAAILHQLNKLDSLTN